MITTTRKHNTTIRITRLLTITCMTTLLLLFGSMALHVSNFLPFSFAHAATTCATTNGTQQEVCEQQNPIVQGCTHDAHVREVETVYTAQNKVIGEVDSLHSERCQTYWVRTIAYANTQHLVKAIDAIISFHTGAIEDSRKVVPSHGQQITTMTDMLFVMPDRIATNWGGKFFLHGQTQPLTIPL